ncbi:MAG: glutamate--tRNA ligase, partial [Deferribacteraceae bacterium]|nr:glutamate--tRNA ligase [Deferribacteraceae bacterium]
RSIKEITELAAPHLIRAGYITSNFDTARLASIVASVRDSLETISEITSATAIYFNPPQILDDAAREVLALPAAKSVLECFLSEISAAQQEHLSLDEYRAIIKSVQKATGAKGKALYMAVRVGVTRSTKGAELDLFIPLMPIKTLKERVEQVIRESF